MVRARALEYLKLRQHTGTANVAQCYDMYRDLQEIKHRVSETYPLFLQDFRFKPRYIV